jgi:cytochrome c oxidase subunit 4
MADHGHDHEYTKGGAHANHILPQLTIIKIAVALFALMAITIGAAFMVPEPFHSNTAIMQSVALAIAVIKASLVVYYYMGVKFGTRLVKVFAYGGFVWFLMLFIMMADYSTRPTEPVVGWETVSSSALPRNTAENPD